MILIDTSVGSRELLQSIRSYGADAELLPIPTDIQFTGRGPDGDVLIGMEKKTITELLQSMRSKRLAGQQVRPMLLTYDIRYLIIEGYWRRGRETGLVEVRNGVWSTARGSFKYSEISRFLASLRELGDLRIWRTADEGETAAYIAEEWHWWQKDWNEHKTGQALYIPEIARASRGTRPMAFHQKPNLKLKWLASLPGIDAKARDLAQYFVSAGDVASATVERLEAVRGIGKKTAREIVDEIGRTDV